MSNHTVIRGRLGGDAEAKSTQNGHNFVSFSVASDVGYGDKKETLWCRCTLWGKRGDSLMPYLKKGTAVCVLGEISLRTWQDNQGQNRTDLQVNCQDIWLIGSKPQTNQPTQNGGSVQRTPPPTQAQSAQVTFDNDEVPF